MTVYLLHFHEKLSDHAQHYIGYSTPANLKRRIEHHKAGSGARLTQVCNERNITYELARVWDEGDRDFERRLKKCKKARRFCPMCNAKALQNMTPEKLKKGKL